MRRQGLFPNDNRAMPSATVPDRAARRRCPACALPSATCLCALVARVDNRVEVLVLQHPLEEREAKGSARLLRLSLARCRVERGETFDPAALEGWLRADGRSSVLLYPDDGEADVLRDRPSSEATRLVVLDGTWRKSLRMLRGNPLLQALPRLGLHASDAGPGRYGALRKARRPVQLSTLEAACAALARLEGDAGRYAPLLRAFDRFVDAGVARRANASA